MEYSRFIWGEVDHTVGHYNVDRIVINRHRLDFSLADSTFCTPIFALLA